MNPFTTAEANLFNDDGRLGNLTLYGGSGGGAKDAGPLMEDPHKYYTPQLQELARKRIGKIRCPIMIAQGDRDSLKKINSEIIVPEMKAQGKAVELVWYPNQTHGFYWGRTPDQAAALQCFQDADAFFKKHIKAQPVAMDKSLFQRVSVR